MAKDLLDLAGDVADGQTPDWEAAEGEASPVGNLKKLQRLSEAFGKAREDSLDGRGRPAFKWCHLEVYEQIGSGGFGEVYRAFDPVLNREVALKLRHPDQAGAQDQILIQEARRMARVRHPNVLAVHGADIDAGQPGIWSDLLTGQTLEAVLTQGHRSTARQLLDLALPLAAALFEIHRRGLVHGDIKAANVMLQADGTPILMDFGAGGEQDAASSGPTRGSPLVMAPELLAGAEQGPAGDVYSLAVLFYRMLSGDYPVTADDLDGLRRAHERGAAIDWRPIPRSLRGLLQTMLGRDPMTRPPAEEVLAALSEIRARPARRRRTAALAAVILALGAGLVAAGLGYQRARQSEQRALSAQAESEYALEFMQSLLSSPRGVKEGINVRVADVIDRARRELEFAPPRSPSRRASIANTLGQTYAALGRHEVADELFQSVISLLENERPAPAEELIEARINLGSNAKQAGQYDRALEILEAAEREAAADLAEGHRLHVEALIGIAHVYQNLGSIQLWEQTLAKAAALADALEEPGITPALIRNRQAHVYMRQDPARAERLAREAREWIIEREGEKNTHAVAATDQLAIILIELGEFEEAEELLRSNTEIIQQRLPEGSAMAIHNLSHLGIVMDRRGRAEEALEFSQRALDMAGRLFGDNDDTTLTLRINHAVRLQEIGRLDAAEEAYRTAVAYIEQIYGPAHRRGLITKGNLAELLLITGQLDEAEQVAREVYQTDIETLGEEHLITLFVMDVLGATLCRQSNFAEGLAMLRRSYELKTANFGPDNPYTHDTAFYLGEALLQTGDSTQAAALLEGVVESRSADLGGDHPKTRTAQHLLERARAQAAAAENGDEPGPPVP